MKLLPASILAASIAAAPAVWHVSQTRLAPPPPPKIGLRDVEAELVTLRTEVAQLRARIDGLDARTSLGLLNPTRAPEPEPQAPAASDTLQDAFAQVVLIADRRSANEGLTVARPAFLEELFGLPREDLNDECQPLTNPTLNALIATEDVGPIRARLIRPALVSLRQVFANVQVFEPELYERIESAGSLCVRRIRGAERAASAHAYGLAVDINIDGVLDELADGKTQLGLILLADFFKREGWVWGAGFGREDSMHFEVSREKLEQWRRLGEI